MSVDSMYAPHSMDGTLLLEAALSAGCEVDLFPRQVMTCWEADATADRRSFVHGVPQTTTLSGATFAQDKRVSRALLEQAGLPIVQGATFSFRGPRAALRYTLRTGFPVHLRLAIENSVQPRILTARSRRSFRRAFDEIRHLDENATASATNWARSAYSLTGLLDPVDDGEGNRLWAPSTRVLVERLPRRWRRFQVLVLGEEAIAVVGLGLTIGKAVDDSKPVDATGVLSSAQLRGAITAAQSLPGLGLARVELVAPASHGQRAKASFRIRDVSERPNLSTFESARSGWGPELADQILVDSGFSGGERRPTHRTVHVRFEGVDDTTALESALSPFDCPCKSDRLQGTLEAQLGGKVPHLARTMTECLSDGYSGARAMHVAVRED